MTYAFSSPPTSSGARFSGQCRCVLKHSTLKKTVASALWTHLTLVVCYLPYTIATALIISTARGFTPRNAIAWNISGILVFLNSSLNPILYCWKIREVRQALIETIRPCF